MPLIKPTPGESLKDFIARGMKDKNTKGEFPDEKQRLAYLNSQFRRKSFEVRKVGDQNLVFGWASVSVQDGEEIVDLQGDMISPDELEKAAYDFVLEFRDTGIMHKGESRGTMVESVVFTEEKLKALGLDENAIEPGWWVGFKVDDEAFAQVKAGEFPMFSIQGRADSVEV